MSRTRFKPRAVFNYVATNEAVWHDYETGTRLAPGAVQNWPTYSTEAWLQKQRKAFKEAKKKPALIDAEGL